MRKVIIWLFCGVLGFVLLFIGIKVTNSLLYKSTGSSTYQPTLSKTNQVATFAGGCFWCMEPPFEKLAGVKSVIAGYTGGHVPNPSYQEVSSHQTGHVEAVQVVYDPRKISYQQLLDVYWKQIDPTDPNGQFVDQGESYRSVIFYHDQQQLKQATASKQQLAQSKRFSKPIVTEIKPAQTFYQAETYHQDYYRKNTLQYHYYRQRSGRDQFLSRIWGDVR